MLLDQDEFEEEAPVLSRAEASHRAMQAFIELLEQQSETSLSEDDKRRIFLRHGLWMPSKRHWRMEKVPYYRSLEDDGKLIPLRSSRS